MGGQKVCGARHSGLAEPGTFGSPEHCLLAVAEHRLNVARVGCAAILFSLQGSQ